MNNIGIWIVIIMVVMGGEKIVKGSGSCTSYVFSCPWGNNVVLTIQINHDTSITDYVYTDIIFPVEMYDLFGSSISTSLLVNGASPSDCTDQPATRPGGNWAIGITYPATNGPYILITISNFNTPWPAVTFSGSHIGSSNTVGGSSGRSFTFTTPVTPPSILLSGNNNIHYINNIYIYIYIFYFRPIVRELRKYSSRFFNQSLDKLYLECRYKFKFWLRSSALYILFSSLWNTQKLCWFLLFSIIIYIYIYKYILYVYIYCLFIPLAQYAVFNMFTFWKQCHL